MLRSPRSRELCQPGVEADGKPVTEGKLSLRAPRGRSRRSGCVENASWYVPRRHISGCSARLPHSCQPPSRAPVSFSRGNGLSLESAGRRVRVDLYSVVCVRDRGGIAEVVRGVLRAASGRGHRRGVPVAGRCERVGRYRRPVRAGRTGGRCDDHARRDRPHRHSGPGWPRTASSTSPWKPTATACATWKSSTRTATACRSRRCPPSNPSSAGTRTVDHITASSLPHSAIGRSAELAKERVQYARRGPAHGQSLDIIRRPRIEPPVWTVGGGRSRPGADGMFGAAFTAWLGYAFWADG